jgi:Coenzyme PQQ synthesis protein D (PqqD)
VKATLSPSSVVVVTKEQVSCLLGDESAILNMKNSVYYGMNPVGTRVWRLLQQPRTVSELRDIILEEYEVDPTRCERDLLDLLADMQSEGLVEVNEAGQE